MIQDLNVLDLVPMGMFVLDSTHSVRFWNRTLEEWSEIPRAQIVGQSISTYFPQLLVPGLRGRLQTIFAGGPPILLSQQFHGQLIPSRRRDGKLRIEETIVKALPDTEGEGYFALFAIQDVTDLTQRVYEYREMRDQARAEAHERELAEHALAEREAMYRSLIETSPTAIIVMDPLGQVVLVNPQTYAMFGTDNPALLVGHSGYEWIEPEDRARGENEFRRVLDGNIVRNVQLTLHRENGERFVVEMNASRIDDAQGNAHFVILIASDVSERRSAEAAIARHAQEMGELYNTSLEINSQMDLSTLLQAIVERAAMLLKVPMGALYLESNQEGSYERLIAVPPDDIRISLHTGEGLAGQVIARNAAIVVEDYSHWEGREARVDAAFGQALGRTMGVPLRARARVIGAITVKDHVVGTFSPDETRLLSLFADQAAIAIENARLYQQVTRLSETDPLTNMHNRRGFFLWAERDLRHTGTDLLTTSLIAFDIDHFKSVNDTFGHAAGDVVLQKLADTCRSTLRAIDLMARMGGEEFVVLMSGMSANSAYLAAERLRRAIAGLEICVPLADGSATTVRITISVGIAEFSEPGDSLETVMKRADQALYAAKQAGRNRVIVWQPALEREAV